MFIATVVVSVVLALALAGSAFATFTRQAALVAGFDKANVPHSWYPMLGALKLAGAVGLVVGLWVPAIGIAAAACLVAYFAGALSFHIRAGDSAIQPPVALGLLSLATLILRVASA